MSWWRQWWKGKKPAEGSDEEPASPTPSDGPDVPATAADEHHAEQDAMDRKERVQLERLKLLGKSEGADTGEALRMLQSRTGTLRQAGAVEALVQGLSGHTLQDKSSDALRVAVATLLDEQGEVQRAARLVDKARSPAARMFCADLYARDGKLPMALSLIERVLAEDIDLPGALERQKRWAEQLGIQPRAKVHAAAATVLTAQESSHALRILREAARGGAATIYEAEDELLGRRVAYKVYHRGGDDRKQIEREARLSHRFAGRGIVRIFDAHPEEGWLAMEWIRGGSLHQPSPELAADWLVHGWLSDVLVALQRVHRAGFVHADIKPANILLRSAGDAVLSDFGICSEVGSPSLAGTPGYISPERLAGAPASETDDVYAIGRILEDRLRTSQRQQVAIGKQRRSALEALAQRCLAPAEERPADAAALVQALALVEDPGHVFG